MSAATSEKNKKVIQAFYDAAANGDSVGYLDTLHEDFQIQIPPNLPWGGVHHGPEEFQNNVVPMLSAALDLSSLKVAKLFGEGPEVYAELQAVTADTGEQVIIAENWTVLDGKAWRMRLYYFDPRPVLDGRKTSASA
jgi:ketosteroid isomerase-like protein